MAQREQEVRQNCRSLTDSSVQCQRARNNLAAVANGRRQVVGESTTDPLGQPPAVVQNPPLQIPGVSAAEIQNLSNLANTAASAGLNEAEAAACNPPTGNPTSQACQDARAASAAARSGNVVTEQATVAPIVNPVQNPLQNQFQSQIPGVSAAEIQDLSNLAETAAANGLNEAEAAACNPPTGNPTSQACQAARAASAAARGR